MTSERASGDAPGGEAESYLSAVAAALSDPRRRAVLGHLAAEGPVPLEVLARELTATEGDSDGTHDVLYELEVEHVPVLCGIGLAAFDPERRVLEPTETTHTLLACADDMPFDVLPGTDDDAGDG